MRVKGDPNKEWGALPLVEADVKANDYVNIIQHPGGLPKQIALYHNLVIFVGGDRVQYLTDTLRARRAHRSSTASGASSPCTTAAVT